MPNKGGARSIHTAARKGHVGIINTLLQKGEHVDVTTNVSKIKILIQVVIYVFPAEQLHSFTYSRGIREAGGRRNIVGLWS